MKRVLRLIRHTTGLFVCLAVLAGASALAEAQQEESRTRRVRFIDGRTEIVEVLGLTPDKDGLYMKFRGVSSAIPIRWVEIYPADVAGLKNEFLGSRPTPREASKVPTIAGFRIIAGDNEAYEGVEIPGHPQHEVWLKNKKGRFVVRTDKIRHRLPIQLPLTEVYTSDELYEVLLGRLSPVSAEEWEGLGTELVRVGLSDRAVHAFEIAEQVRRPELPEGKLYRALVRFRDTLQDVSLRMAVHRIQVHYLVGEYDAALEQMDSLEKDLSKADRTKEVRELRRLREELQLLRGLARDERILSEWARLMEALVKAKAMDRRVTMREAADYVEKDLQEEVVSRIQQRFRMQSDDPSVKMIWERRPRDARHKHSYGDASWVADRPDRGDSYSWWKSVDDNTRYRYLRGIAIERYYDVREVLEKNCPTCGGDGSVEAARFPDSPAGQCPACRGVTKQRVLIYR